MRTETREETTVHYQVRWREQDEQDGWEHVRYGFDSAEAEIDRIVVTTVTTSMFETVERV